MADAHLHPRGVAGVCAGGMLEPPELAEDELAGGLDVERAEAQGERRGVETVGLEEEGEDGLVVQQELRLRGSVDLLRGRGLRGLRERGRRAGAARGRERSW